MPKQPRGLGRGLDLIFQDNARDDDNGSVLMIPLSDIMPRSDQPRKSFELSSMQSLAESIASNGVIQPLIVKKSPSRDGFYSIIAGERRWRASRMAGLSEVPCVVVEADDIRTAQMALIENIQRQDLNPVEEADGYRVLLETHQMTQEQLAKSVGRSRSAIANTVRLLDLPDAVLDMLRQGKISEGHGRALLAVRSADGIDDAKADEMIISLAKKASDAELSVRQTEKLVKSAVAAALGGASDLSGDDAGKNDETDYAKELSAVLTKRLGRRVRITASKNSRRVIIDYSDNDDLGEIIKKLTGSDNILDE